LKNYSAAAFPEGGEGQNREQQSTKVGENECKVLTHPGHWHAPVKLACAIRARSLASVRICHVLRMPVLLGRASARGESKLCIRFRLPWYFVALDFAPPPPQGRRRRNNFSTTSSPHPVTPRDEISRSGTPHSDLS
jgi:hypothetical protein